MRDVSTLEPSGAGEVQALEESYLGILESISLRQGVRSAQAKHAGTYDQDG